MNILKNNMVILYLGYQNSKIEPFLKQKHKVYCVNVDQPVTLDFINKYSPNYIISHGYQMVLSSDIVLSYKNRIINLHSSYLPWCRGSHPNVWSFIKDTPKGGTIHFISEGLDTGDIIAQEKINIYPDDTLSSTYFRIRILMEDLFIKNWEKILQNKVKLKKQNLKEGSFHYRKDLKKIKHLLYKGWDTPVKHLKKLNGDEKNN
jgi:folate-dependent phosphoribosylglycinamide formyltransferase PurN